MFISNRDMMLNKEIDEIEMMDGMMGDWGL